jgi:hypothetical protein
VSARVALSKLATLVLQVWEGQVQSGQSNAFLTSTSPTPTARLVENLHLAEVKIVIGADSGKSLQAVTPAPWTPLSSGLAFDALDG